MAAPLPVVSVLALKGAACGLSTSCAIKGRVGHAFGIIPTLKAFSGLNVNGILKRQREGRDCLSRIVDIASPPQSEKFTIGNVKRIEFFAERAFFKPQILRNQSATHVFNGCNSVFDRTHFSPP